MSNNADDHLEKLFTAARQQPRDTSRLQFGFETRVMARLREERSPFGAIIAWAWKLCPFFAALALAAGIWSRTTTVRVAAEAHIVAEATDRGEEQVLLAYLTGKER